MKSQFDALILSNGPGELNTWVRPVVAEMVRRYPEARLSVILAPDGNSSGKEHEMARAIPGVARVQPADAFVKFLLTGRTQEQWDWHRRGVVLFLGGDQGLSAFIARRLGYPIVAYAEWQARWTGFIQRFGLREEQVRRRSGKERFAGQFRVVGDLMVDAVADRSEAERSRIRKMLGLEADSHTRWDNGCQLVALLPGSKPAKLALGVPLLLRLIEIFAVRRPGLRFVIPVAPGLSGAELARYARPDSPDLPLVGGTSGRLVTSDGAEYLESAQGARVRLWYERPAYPVLAETDLALTTVGANTAELGGLGVPMLVLVPTNRLDIMRAWDGLPGLLSNLPGKLGTTIATAINRRITAKLGLLAWPNIRAGRMIVPELVRPLTAADLVPLIEEWLDDHERRVMTRRTLIEVMGGPGASAAFVDLVESVLAEVR